MLLSLVTWLWYVNPYLQYVFPVVSFTTSAKSLRIMILLYSIISICSMITSLDMNRLVFACNTVVVSIPWVLSFGIY